jgi:phage shock protein A
MPKTVVQELVEARQMIAAHEATIAEHIAAVGNLTANLDAAAKEITALREQIAQMDKAKCIAVDALAAEQSAHAATKAELDKAKNALANPAFVDAGARGQASPTPEGGSSADVKTPEQAQEEYRKLQRGGADAKTLEAYRNQHARELGLLA